MKTKAVRFSCYFVIASIILALVIPAAFALGSNDIQVTIDEINQGRISYTIDSQAAYSNALAVTAVYNEKMQMVDIRRTPLNISVGSNTYFVNFSNSFECAKVFLVDANTYKPLSRCATRAVDYYSVQFRDYNGTLLSEQLVRSGSKAVRPSPPTRNGFIFAGWSPALDSISDDTVYTAQYLTGQEQNIFRVETKTGSVGNTVTVSVKLEGTVLLSGFDMKLYYDENLLEYVGHDAELSLDVTANKVSGSNRIAFNYSSYKNVASPKEILQVTFRIKNADQDFAPIWIDPISVCYTAQNGELPPAEFHIAEGGVMIR